MSNSMETTYTFRNMEPTRALEEHTSEKLVKLEKFIVTKPASVHVIFNVDGSTRHVAEITITSKGSRYFGSETSTDMYNSVDGAVKKLEKQLVKKRERVKGHKGE